MGDVISIDVQNEEAKYITGGHLPPLITWFF